MTVREVFEDEQLLEDLEEIYCLERHQWKLSDVKILFNLIKEGRFFACECGYCDTRFYRIYPDSWQYFQGCHSDEGLGNLCENCTGLYLELKRYAED